MTDETYNGWANYETWAVNLHLTNEPAADATLRNLAAEAAADWSPHPAVAEHYADAPDRVAAARVRAAADTLEGWCREELAADVDGEPWGGLTGDLLGRALSRVDWDAGAAAALEGVDLEGR